MTLVIAEGQSAAVKGTGTPTGVWWALLVALLGSTVVAGLITTTVGSLRASATSRRDGYAQAVKSLIARTEYAYRVRRRVSDEPDVLAALASRGNDLQEQLAACRTWVQAESRTVGRVYEEVLADLDAKVNPAAADAWTQPPVATAAGMNLSGWGPGDQWPHIIRLENAISFRFGWRRILPPVIWRRQVWREDPGRG
ncbi:MAG: hypothetical protein ABJA86_07925 [Nocardioidaceae bacterium]